VKSPRIPGMEAVFAMTARMAFVSAFVPVMRPHLPQFLPQSDVTI